MLNIPPTSFSLQILFQLSRFSLSHMNFLLSLFNIFIIIDKNKYKFLINRITILITHYKLISRVN